MTIVLSLWGLAALALVARLAVALLRLEGLKRDAIRSVSSTAINCNSGSA